MRPKGKLFALFAVFAAIGLVTASGAFTTVTAERTAEVTASDDADALLAIEAANGPNGDDYVETTDQASTVQLLLDGDQGASGINNNATTEVDNVLNITNQGTQDVNLYFVTEGQNKQVVEFTAETANDPSTNITEGSVVSDASSANSITLTTGETATVSMTMDTNGVTLTDDEEILTDVTIRANATNTASP